MAGLNRIFTVHSTFTRSDKGITKDSGTQILSYRSFIASFSVAPIRDVPHSTADVPFFFVCYVLK